MEAAEELFYQLKEDKDNTMKLKTMNEAENIYRQEYESRMAAAFEKAWEVKYVGHSDKLLQDAMVSWLKDSSEHFNNFCSIIQGSGSGKSRLVDRLAESVFTIPVVLRPAEDKSGFPLGDTANGEALLDFFSATSYSALRIQRLYLQFLLRILAFADKWIDAYKKSGHATKHIAAAWREYLGPPRSAQRNAMYAQAIENSRLEGFEDIFHQEVELEDLQERVKPSIEAITRKIKPTTKEEPIIIFYFDEAQHLTERTVVKDSEQEPSTAYQCLCRAFTYLFDTPVFALFISAYSSLVKDPYVPRFHYWSARPLSLAATENDKNMNVPFVELPFDTWKEPYLVNEGGHSGEEICSLRFMARFGRPGFWALLENGASDENDVMQLAISRLELPSNTPIDEGLKYPCQALIPLLAARVDFSFNSSRDETVLLERHLVTSTMRTAFSIPQHRQYIHGGYPSEPFLAEAAARAMLKYFHTDAMREGEVATVVDRTGNDMNKVIANYKDVVPSVISAWTRQGLIDEELKEELVAMLFCTLAHDISVLEKLPPEMNILEEKALFSQMVPVVDFLQALIAAEHVENVLKAKPSNMPGKTLEEVFANAFVHFTQFVKTSDTSIINNKGSYFLFTRGAAMRCTGKMSGAGLVIPIWIKSDGNPDRWHMTAIFIQLKHPADEEVTFVDAQDRFKFFSASEAGRGDEHPYISITMEFPERGSHEGFSAGEVKVTEYEANQAIPDLSGSHPRYEIFIKGCSKEVYNVVGEVSYCDFLVPEDVMSEHPRGGEFLDAVKEMKPYFGVDSYGWAGDMSEADAGTTAIGEGKET